MTERTGKFSGDLKEFKRFFAETLERSGIAGGGFAFLRGGETLAGEFYGWAHLEKDQRADENTIWHWASNTKPLTGIAVIQLRDRGLLSLDDPAIEFLPELKAVHNPFGDMKTVTVRHLMNHTAGFRSSTFPFAGGESWQPFEPQKYSQIEAMLPYTEILFPPGSRFHYSNLGIVFLGQIIERLTGDDYEVYVDKNIFKPLAMHRSYFDRTPYHLLDHRAHSYFLENGTRTEGRFDADSGATAANSGWNAPLPDVVKYLNFLVGVGDRNGVYDIVLKRRSLEEMFAPTAAADLDANDNAGFSTDIGLIFFLDRKDGETHIGHGGDQNGFISYIELNMRKRTASVMVFNTKVISPVGEDVYAKLRCAARALHERFR